MHLTVASCFGSTALFVLHWAAPVHLAHAQALPERVTFASADGRTTLIGYLFKPTSQPAGRVPAVVMMHGRGGAYSSLAKGNYEAATLSKRHVMWGELWAGKGYLAIMVDGFGPRGYPAGFPRHSYESRPAELSEVTIRPLDSYGALAYLRSRRDVIADRVGLLGWSNGGSAAISTLSVDAPGLHSPTPVIGFRAALAFYPACGLKGQFDSGYRPYAPVQVFHGADDEEVSAERCKSFVERSHAQGGDIQIRVYKGATHGFDDPGTRRREVEGNAEAAEDAIRRSVRFFAQHLEGRKMD
jgi:dienelactone hydrolase